MICQKSRDFTLRHHGTLADADGGIPRQPGLTLTAGAGDSDARRGASNGQCFDYLGAVDLETTGGTLWG